MASRRACYGREVPDKLHPSRARGPRGLVKRLIDRSGAALGIVAAAPVVLAAAAAIRIEGGGPVFFVQERIGADNEPFYLYKLRTMRTSTVAPDGRPLGDADRITRLGRFLRASSIDELPQLFNIWRGDMSIVGPRPLLPRYLPRYSPEQARRHEVRPGLTGWAQVNGRNTVTWDEKFQLDVWYVDNWSLALDARIIGRTVARVLGAHGISSEGHATMPEFAGATHG
jgi:sugar transferase EpsL